jgi:hypothetical protein
VLRQRGVVSSGGVNRVADDPVAEHVFDRAEIQCAFCRGVFGDIAESQLIWTLYGEITLQQVLVHTSGAAWERVWVSCRTR